jgi:hypothetical protein
MDVSLRGIQLLLGHHLEEVLGELLRVEDLTVIQQVPLLVK